MTNVSDLEIRLTRGKPEMYQAQLSYRQPGSEKCTRLSTEHPFMFRFNELAKNQHDPVRYGQLLADDLLADPAMARAFHHASTGGKSKDRRLRMRLVLAPDATELHDLHWETLRDPQGLPLLANDQVLFSRRPADPTCKTPPKEMGTQLKATVAICNPRGLVPLNMKEELDRVAAGMAGLGVLEQRPKTLDGILGRLEGCDLFYLACRASSNEGESFLWFENEQGMLTHVLEDDFVGHIKQLERPPRLMILVSYQAPGHEHDYSLSHFGSRLAEAGMPAVLSLLGHIPAPVTTAFLAGFFDELKQHGIIDRAVAAARAKISASPDYWKPTLYLRPQNDCLWQTRETSNIGRRIGAYRLERKLGQGGMGTVYLARRQDDVLEMAAAIKLAHERLCSGEEMQRFHQERQFLANLKHPHIAMLLDAGTTEQDHPYFIMEHIEGSTVDHWCATHQPDLARLLRLFRKITVAVGFAHGKGIVHRDIKPGNLMVTAEGEPKLLDFGTGINRHLST